MMSSTENKHPYCSATKKVAAIGMFDGVHIGHQHLIKALLATAKSRNMESMVITFNEHPATTLQRSTPAMLMDREQRKQALQKTGINHVLFLDFTADFARLTAAEFLGFIAQNYNVGALILGFNHHFGSDGRTLSHNDYVQLGKAVGIDIICADEFTLGSSISSTTIRRMVTEGDFTNANALLGKPFTIEGTIVEGFHNGRKLGFPTANLNPKDSNIAIPANGVYAVIFSVTSGKFANSAPMLGVCNVGLRPTVSPNGLRTIETHILDFDGDLYGASANVAFIASIRGEVRFDSLTALKQQISLDADAARQILTTNSNQQLKSI